MIHCDNAYEYAVAMLPKWGANLIKMFNGQIEISSIYLSYKHITQPVYTTKQLQHNKRNIFAYITFIKKIKIKMYINNLQIKFI